MENLKNIDWSDIVNHLSSFATSELARDLIQKTAPLKSATEARHSYTEIFAAQELLINGERPHMASVDLTTPWLLRLEKSAVLKILELRDIRTFCLEVVALDHILRDFDSQWAKETRTTLMDAARPLSAIDSLLTPTGEIRTDASEKLYNLYHEKENLVRHIQSTLDQLVKKHAMEAILQDRFVTTREGRWVLPVRSGMQHSFDGIIHATSQSKQTVFMEPEELVPINNRLRQLEIAIDEEIERLLKEISLFLETLLNEFRYTREILIATDIRLAQAELTSLIDGSPCQFATNHLKIIEGRHPLLVLNKQNVIANTIELTTAAASILLLSGPNAGGKTILLKTIGLIAHMARCGLPIPAKENSVLPFFNNIVVAVGDAQSVDANLSTFAAHLQILDRATQIRGSDNLLLIDEICGSTDPEEGSALARSFINRYAQNQLFAIITSHLGPLKTGWVNESHVCNGSLEYDTEAGRPTYNFIMGVCGQSLAIQTAKMVGVSKDILEEAITYLSPERRAEHTALTEINEMKNDLRKLQAQLHTEQQEANNTKQLYTNLSLRLEQEKEKILKDFMAETAKRLDEMLAHTRIDSVFKKQEVLTKLQTQMPQIVKSTQIPRPTPITNADEFSQKFPPGSKIFIPALNREGVIQGLPNPKGEVPVLSNSMRLNLPWQELKPPQQLPNTTTKAIRQILPAHTINVVGTSEIDLRGKTVDEAIDTLEHFLDQATYSQNERIKVIHGHGTQALKKAVRNYLSRSIYVKTWNAGTPETGSDGITWVEINDNR